MKKGLLFLLAFCVVMTFSVSAQAFVVKFETADYFAWGRLYDTSGVPQNLNPFDGSSSVNLPLDTYVPVTGANKTEDAFGITRISRIATPDGQTVLFGPAGQPGVTDQITVFFYGADDVMLTSPDVAGNQTLLSTNFHILVYYDALPSDYNTTLGTAGRTGTTTYNTVTDGVLLLDMVGHTQFLDWNAQTQTGTQAFQNLETGQPTTGQFVGSILFDVIGGAWQSLYDTNTIAVPKGPGMADMTFSFSTQANPGVSDWLIGDTSNAFANIPEPSTFILMGIGIVGLFASRRKKN